MPDKYQQLALKTWHKNLDINLQIDHAVLGLVGEAGELANIHKKIVFKPGYKKDDYSWNDELADIFYYLLILAHLDGKTLDDLLWTLECKLIDGHGWQSDNYNRACAHQGSNLPDGDGDDISP